MKKIRRSIHNIRRFTPLIGVLHSLCHLSIVENMKCFEMRKCTEEERGECFVYASYADKADLEDVKCWIMNGAFQRGNREQLEKCMACAYYQTLHKDSGVQHADTSNATVVSVTGPINNDRAKALEDVLAQLLEKHRYFVILNLKNVNNVYSCGLGIIIRMHKEMVAQNGYFVVACPQPYVSTIFETTKLDRFLKISQKESDAFALIEDKVRGEKKMVEQAELSEKKAKEIEEKKSQKCWEYWDNHNPNNANTCDECFRKIAHSDQACWIVEGSVEGVSFQYVNEDCEDCEYYLMQSNATQPSA